MGRPRRSRARNQSDAEPPGLHRRARHRARPLRRRHGQVHRSRYQAGQGRIPLPGEGDGGRRHAVSGLCAAAGARRQERPVAGVAAEAADVDRIAPDQRAGRHHQFHDLRPRPAAPRVRRQEGERQSHGAPRQGRREPAGARWPHLHARSRDLRDRGRARRRIAGRHHGRRDVRLRREHHRRADRIGAVERDQHRADRPQARHQFGCALSVRARRRSGLHGAGPRARHQTGDGIVRRHAVGERGRRQCLRRRPHHRFPAERGQTSGGNRSARWSRCGAFSAISASWSPAAARW